MLRIVICFMAFLAALVSPASLNSRHETHLTIHPAAGPRPRGAHPGLHRRDSHLGNRRLRQRNDLQPHRLHRASLRPAGQDQPRLSPQRHQQHRFRIRTRSHRHARLDLAVRPRPRLGRCEAEHYQRGNRLPPRCLWEQATCGSWPLCLRAGQLQLVERHLVVQRQQEGHHSELVQCPGRLCSDLGGLLYR